MVDLNRKNVLNKTLFVRQIHFLAQTISFDLDATHRNIEQRGDFFGGKIEPEIRAKPQIVWC